jgi:hypothetical protein
MPDSIPCPKCGRLYVWTGTRCCHKDCRFGANKKPRKLRVKIAGVYAVDAEELVHLIEILIEGGAVDGFDFGQVTQELPDKPRMNWQVPYDERVISESDGKARVVFFFHCLDLNKPLLTPAGAFTLPPPRKIPARLKEIAYKAP